jgi:hypothetical protein
VKRVRRLPYPRGPRDVVVWTVGAGAIAFTSVVGYVLGAGTFSAERAQLVARLNSANGGIAKVADQTRQRPSLNRAMQGFIDRTLGSDSGSSDGALRSRLNRIGEELRLLDLSVKTQAPVIRFSPAKSAFEAKGSQKTLRDEADFVEVQATISGEGTADQVLRLVHRIEHEPWIKRIDQVRFDQTKGGERLRTTVKLTTLFLPGKKPKSDPRLTEEERVALEQSFERYRPIANTNPFRVPVPVKVDAGPTAVAQAPVQPPPPQLGFPYDQWQLTGLVDGPAGIEAWVRNPVTGERRELQVGQVIGEIAFVGVNGDVAEFSLGQDRFRVQVGTALSARTPMP